MIRMVTAFSSEDHVALRNGNPGRQRKKSGILAYTNNPYFQLEVRGPSGPQLLVGGPWGRLDFVLRALWALRPCDPRNDVVSVHMVISIG